MNLSPSGEQPVLSSQAATPEICWRMEASGAYSARSAYLLQFQGSASSHFKNMFWSAWAPGKTKIFTWLLLQNRLWCNDRLHRRDLGQWAFLPSLHVQFGKLLPPFLRMPNCEKVWGKVAQWQGCNSLNAACWPSSTNSVDQANAVINATVLVTSHLWQAELCACKEGLSISLQRCDLPIIIEMDSINAVNMIRSKVVDRSMYAHLVQDIKQLVSSHNACITHVPHSCNKASDKLASFCQN